ncbi:hypothetical protein EV687_2717 [Corticibacter populi]|nr:hypothetical protein EV687_2717 [Corticibacter populi]
MRPGPVEARTALVRYVGRVPLWHTAWAPLTVCHGAGRILNSLLSLFMLAGFSPQRPGPRAIFRNTLPLAGKSCHNLNRSLSPRQAFS